MARISTLKDDPGYDPRAYQKVSGVTVDGVSVQAFTADEEQGYALTREKVGEAGSRRVELYGVVKIQWREAAP